MDPASTTLKLLLALALIAVNAFFVATEHSLSAARRTRIEPVARAGGRRARQVLTVLDSPADTIAAAQLGATLATLALGYLAEGMLHSLLLPWLTSLNAAYGIPVSATLTHGTAIIVTLLALGLVHGVLATQVPRMLASQKPESVAGWTTLPARGFAVMLRPLLRLVTSTAALLGRGLGLDPAGVQPLPTSAEDLRLLMEQGAEGAVETEQEQMLLGVIQFRDTLAREVMTPRRDIIALPATATRADTLALVAEEGHSRIPVYDASIDDVIGVLLVKDLLAHVITHPSPESDAFDLRALAREPYFVPDTKRIGELLAELRTKSVHMAIVLDEFGGTDGLVTLEDMLEEIVGDIYDEHDVPEEEEDFAITESGDIIIDGSASIFDVNERFGLQLPEQDYDTIGGFVFGELGRVPVPGDIVALNGAGELYVDAVEERRVTRVRLVPAATEALHRDDTPPPSPGG
jgi:putative hemolysin